MDFNPVILAIPLFFGAIALELMYEAITKKHTYRLNDALTNINLGSLDQVTGIFTKVLTVFIFAFVYDFMRLVTISPTWTSFFVLFVLYDLAYYWSHRMAHEVSLFWGGHVVHHQSEDYNLSVALRQSSTGFIWSLPFYIPLALIGFNPTQMVFVGGFNLIYQFWIHTEHINKMPRWFEFFMNTPSHHRVHHAKNPKYIDKNYAGVFIIWDKIFGSFKKEEERPVYGITKSLESWNPVYANFAHYIDLFKNTSRARSVGDVFGILFKKPGWNPDYLGGYQQPPAISDQNKYDKDTSIQGMKIYVFVQFLIFLGLSAYFLFNIPEDNSGKILFSLWIIFSTVMISLYFEYSGIWVRILEVLRLLALPLLGIILGFSFDSLLSFSLIVLAVLSGTFFLFKMRPHK